MLRLRTGSRPIKIRDTQPRDILHHKVTHSSLCMLSHIQLNQVIRKRNQRIHRHNQHIRDPCMYRLLHNKQHRQLPLQHTITTTIQ